MWADFQNLSPILTQYIIHASWWHLRVQNSRWCLPSDSQMPKTRRWSLRVPLREERLHSWRRRSGTDLWRYVFSFIQTVFSYHHAILKIIYNSLRKQPSGPFGDVTTGFPAKKSRLRNERINFILMKRHYPDLGSASDWLNHVSHAARPIRSTTHIWVVTRHQYGISELVSKTSFGGESSGTVAKCRLFLRLILWL